MVRPQIGCSTFISLDFIRVPLPAASTTTAVGLPRELPAELPGARCEGLLPVAFTGLFKGTPSLRRHPGSPGRSRTYVALSAFKVRRALPTDQPGIGEHQST